MLDKAEIKNRLLNIIEKYFAINKEKIVEDTKFSDLGIDKFSTDFVDLLMLIEKNFEIEIGNDNFVNTEKISDIVNLIEVEVAKKEENKINKSQN